MDTEAARQFRVRLLGPARRAILMSGSRKPSSSALDWRGRTHHADSRKKGKWLKRILLTATTLILVGILVVAVLVGVRVPVAQVVFLPVRGYDVLTGPAPFLARADLEKLDAFAKASRAPKAIVLDKLQDSLNIAKLGDRLQELVTDRRQRLILFVSAQGVSDGGKPYLLCSNFLHSHSAEDTVKARYELKRVFADARQSQAAIKLVLLDCAHGVSDPRLGMVVNEFGRLLEGEVRAVEDPDLWVIAASRPLELSRVSYAAKKTYFAHYVAEALQGKADLDRNGFVDLGELFRFVRDGVSAAVAKEGGDDETQTPTLLRGTVGQFVGQFQGDLPSDRLFWVPRSESAGQDVSAKAEAKPEAGKADAAGGKPAAAAEKTGTPAEKPATAEEKPGAAGEKPAGPPDKSQAVGTKASAAVEKPAAAGEKPADAAEKPAPSAAKAEAPSPKTPAQEPEPAAGKKPAGGDAIRDLLGQAWRQRDTMQQRGPGEGWSPVDYAPHLWREYQRLILGHELRYRYGVPFSPSDRAALGQLASPSVDDAASILGRLEKARKDFLASGAADPFAGPEPNRRVVRQAIQLKNDLVLAAPDYVGWCAYSGLVTSGNPVPVQQIGQLLERLREFIAALERLEEGNRPADASAAVADQEIAGLLEKRKELEGLRLRVDKSIEGLVAEVHQRDGKGKVGKIEGLLATPLLPAKTRLALLERLGESGPPPQEGIAPRDRAGLDEARWKRLAEVAELEIRLATLSGVDLPTPPRAALFEPPGESERWHRFGGLGVELKKFYEETVPQAIRKGFAAKSPDELRRVRRMLALVDARDVRDQVEPGTGAVAVPAIAWRTLLPVQLALGDEQDAKGPGPVKLARDETWKQMAIPVRTTPPTAITVALRLTYDDAVLEVREADRKLLLRTEADLAIALGQDGQKTVVLEARPKSVARWPDAPPSLALSAKAGEATATRKIAFELVARDEVELIVERVVEKTRVPQSARPVRGGQTEPIRLEPFANRTTDFAFQLRNLFDQPRTVTVQLFAARPGPGDDRPARKDPFDGFGQMRREFEKLSEPVEVKLPASQKEPEPIDFSIPPAGEKNGKNGKKEPPAGAGPPEPKKSEPARKDKDEGADKSPPGKEISFGIACVIQEKATKKTWTKWVELKPVPPSDYVNPTIRYDPTERRVSVAVRLRDELRLLPPLSPEEPVRIEWEIVDVANAEFVKRPTRPLALAQAGAEDRLGVEGPAEENRTVRLSMTVDGWPRAMVFDVECRRDGKVTPLGDLRQVRIKSPRPGQTFRAPLPRGTGLPVELQVDAPHDAFLDPENAENALEVWLEAQGDTRTSSLKSRFHGDRQAIFRLEKVGPLGLVRVRSEVRDYRFELDTQDTRDTRASVVARLVLRHPSRPDDKREDRVEIILDGLPPQLTVAAPSVADPDDVIPITLEIDDLSGVKKIEYGFDRNSNGQLDDNEKFPEIPAKGNKIELSVPTKEVKPALVPGQSYSLRIRVTDNVDLFSEKAIPIAISQQAVMPATTVGTIQGQVFYRTLGNTSVDWTRLSVVLEGTGRTAEGDLGGKFTFPNVPFGEYKVRAEGIAANVSGLTGTAQVKLDKAVVRVEIVASK